MTAGQLYNNFIFRNFCLCFRRYKLQSPRIPRKLLHLLIRRSHRLYSPDVLGDALLPLENILLSPVKVKLSVFIQFITCAIVECKHKYEHTFIREGMKAKKRVTKLVLAVILVFTSKRLSCISSSVVTI